jgi:hypothetical protein
MNLGQRYFDVYMQGRNYNTTGRYRSAIQLIKCHRGQWESKGYGETFDRLGLDKWLCPPEGTFL